MTRKNRIIALSVLLFGAVAGATAIASADPAAPAPAAAAENAPEKGKARKGHKRGAPAQHLARIFKKFDKNSDAKLTASEVPEGAWTRLSKADTNGDDAVTLAELKQKIAEHRAKRGERKAKHGKAQYGKAQHGEGKAHRKGAPADRAATK